VIPFEPQTPAVRDLLWAVAGPSLLKPSELFPELFLTAEQGGWFRDLDSDPRDLLHFLNERGMPAETKALGKYFEALWEFWIRSKHKAKVFYSGLKILNHPTPSVLGELDLLFSPGMMGAHIEHWELAVKYYLCTASSPEEADNTAHYYGMLLKDRLDKKLKLLSEKQLKICRDPQTLSLLRSLGLEVPVSRGIIRGRLFYPWNWQVPPVLPKEVNPLHLRGLWCRVSDLAAFAESVSSGHEERWLVLPRHQWIPPTQAHDSEALWLRKPFLEQFLDHPEYLSRRGRMLARLEKGSSTLWWETHRVIVVGDQWGPAGNTE
jgi:hypothetical protein